MWLHLLAVAAGICPSKALAVAVTEQLYEVQEKTEAHVMELEDDDSSCKTWSGSITEKGNGRG